MRVIHLTVVRQLTLGQAKQLKFEYDASQTLEGGNWVTIAFHTGSPTEPYMRRIPAPFRFIFLRNLWGWLVALKLSRSYDIVMMRHMTFDPFAFLFAPFIRNRVSVHHAKEIEELRLVRKDWRGQAASWLERMSARFSVRNAKMILGVTHEIAEYERNLHAQTKSIGIYPNGVNVSQISILNDNRDPEIVNAAFICGTFSPWHGLDKLIAAVDEYYYLSGEPSLKIHLIGKLSVEQKIEIQKTEVRRKIFKAYGLLAQDEYRKLLGKCDIGLTSFALERKGLREASTLKVREMLASGLAVYSGHSDVALPADAAFVAITHSPSIVEMLSFGRIAKNIPRCVVRSESQNRIEKMEAMQSALKILTALKHSNKMVSDKL